MTVSTATARSHAGRLFRPTVTALAALATLCLARPALAVPLPADATAILSGAPSLFEALPAPAGSSLTTSFSTSQDGRYVAFSSYADGLFDGDDDFVRNVYVKDRETGAVTLASRRTGAAGAVADASCDQPAISDDGSRVAFTCEGSLDPADANGVSDVYVRDLTTATTVLVSRAGGLGAVGDARSGRPSLSGSGQFVAFEAEARNLDPAATVGGSHVYRRQIGNGDQTELVSRRSAADGGARVNGSEPSISDDGNRIAFTHRHTAGEQPPDPAIDTNGAHDVYVRDMVAFSTVLASRAAGAGAVGNGASSAPALAGDGLSVAFQSTATQFDPVQDSEAEPDVYRRSLAGGIAGQNTTLVSVNAAGSKGHVSTAPSIDDSGEVVGFLSQATALDPADDGPASDAYVKNLGTSALHLVTRADGATGAAANDGASAVSVSGDGTKAVAGVASGRTLPDMDPGYATPLLRDLAAKRTHSVARPAGTEPFRNEGGRASDAALSRDGRFAAFMSAAAGLGRPAGVTYAVFVRDRTTGSVVLASRADGPAGAPLEVTSSRPAISADGRRVAFAVRDGADQGIWVRDLTTSRTFRASVADGPGGAPGNDVSSTPALDADGSRVAFSTRATNLGNGDTDATSDIHVRDLETGRTILAHRADGATGAKGDGSSNRPGLSADGTRVSFVSRATNLGNGDADALADAHVRDLAAGTTRLASADPAGVKSNANVVDATIDAAGSRVAFDTPATNLPGGAGTRSQVFVRDLAENTLVLASRADGPGGQPASGSAFAPLISPDGGHVAFAAEHGNLSPAAPSTTVGVFLRDLASGRTRLVSRRSGAGGAPALREADTGAVTEDGGCVSFSTDDALFGPTSELMQAYLRVIRADCAPLDAPTGGDRPGQPGDPGAAPDTTAPELAGARLTRRRFRVGRRATAIGARRTPAGTAFSYSLSERATVTIALERATAGLRLKARGCVAPTAANRRRLVRALGSSPRIRRLSGAARRRALRRALTRRRCTRHLAAGALTRTGQEAGPVRTAFSGRVGRRALRPGRYRARLSAADAAGNRSVERRLTFRVVRR